MHHGCKRERRNSRQKEIPVKRIQTGAIALLAVVSVGGCQSAQTREAKEQSSQQAAVNGMCSGLGERAGFGTGRDGLPAEASVTRSFNSRGLKGYCYTTPNTIAADERKRRPPTKR
jgi:hypothetical protein